MESQLIRILPACLTEPLPKGWDASSPEYLVEVMPTVDQPAAIVMALPTTEPDILLIDADFEGADMFAVATAALQARPELAVVILSREGAPESLRKAMFAGAEEYLISPSTARLCAPVWSASPSIARYVWSPATNLISRTKNTRRDWSWES